MNMQEDQRIQYKIIGPSVDEDGTYRAILRIDVSRVPEEFHEALKAEIEENIRKCLYSRILHNCLYGEEQKHDQD